MTDIQGPAATKEDYSSTEQVLENVPPAPRAFPLYYQQAFHKKTRFYNRGLFIYLLIGLVAEIPLYFYLPKAYKFMKLIVPLVIVFGGLTMRIIWEVHKRQYQQAYVNGRPTIARISTSYKDKKLRHVPGHPLYEYFIIVDGRHRIGWEFEVDNKTYFGGFGTDHLALIQPYFDQKEVCIIYDPQRPAANLLFDVRLEN